MSATPGVLLQVDGLPILPPGGHPDQAARLCWQVLRWIGEQQHDNLAKIYMPLAVGGASHWYSSCHPPILHAIA